MVHPEGIEPPHLVPETNALSTELRVHRRDSVYYNAIARKAQDAKNKTTEDDGCF